jgi:hypothetical protein
MTASNDCGLSLVFSSLFSGRSTYLYCIPDFLLPSLFNQFRSADFPFRIFLLNLIDSCTERYGGENIVGNSSILNVRCQYIMGDEVRSTRFPVMGAEFHLRSRNVVVQALITWSGDVQSAAVMEEDDVIRIYAGVVYPGGACRIDKSFLAKSLFEPHIS